MKTLLLYSDETMFIKDMNFVYLGASKAFAELAGLDNPSQLIGKSDFDIFSNQELAKRYHADDLDLLNNGKPLLHYVEPVPSTNGESIYYSTSKYIIRNDVDEPIGILGVSKDITREYVAKLNYEKELRYLFELPENAIFAVLFDITSWRVVDYRIRNEHNVVISKYHTIEEFQESAVKSVAYDNEIKDFLKGFTKENVDRIFNSGKRSIVIEYERYINDLDIHWVEEEFHFLIDSVSNHQSVLIIIRDIDKQRRAEKEMLQAALKDGLTKLDNRNTIIRKIKNVLLQDVKSMHALFMIDIDNFKYMNDHFGHQYGDDVLVIIATIISSCFHKDDFVGRIGGDEFFAFSKNASIEQVKTIAKTLVHELNNKEFPQKNGMKLSCSIGISIYNNDNKSFETLYKEADTALYTSKSHGKNQYTIFEVSKPVSNVDDTEFT